MSGEPVTIKVLDREYTVGVGESERDSLMAAAQLLDQQMRDVRGSNRMAAIDRVAVLAALNFAHELHLLRERKASDDRALVGAIGDLNRKLDSLLDA